MSRNVQKHQAQLVPRRPVERLCSRMETLETSRRAAWLDQTPERRTTSRYRNWQRWVQMSSLGLLESPSPREVEYGALRMIGGNRIARVAGFGRRRRRTPGKLLSKPSSLARPLGPDPGPFPKRSHGVPYASTTNPSSVPQGMFSRGPSKFPMMFPSCATSFRFQGLGKD